MRATGAEVERRWFLAQLAERMGRAGRPEEGLALLAEALASVPTTGEHLLEAELYRLQGELLLGSRPGVHTEAAACFQQALNVARQQQAKSLELRAAMSLSRLWQQQGKQAARELLAPIYGWFTEGFDTADLLDAQTLLRTLAAEPPILPFNPGMLLTARRGCRSGLPGGSYRGLAGSLDA